MLSLRLCIWTDLGPIGPRLERGGALPPYERSYPDTDEGRKQATEDIKRIERYMQETQTKKKIK
jgi:hypothetical protein